MSRSGFGYNRETPGYDGIAITGNNSMAKEYDFIDNIHFDSIGYQQYGMAVSGWLANIIKGNV